jgi:hypothetical protein
VLVLTFAAGVFVGIGVVISLVLGMPFVIPSGESPAVASEEITIILVTIGVCLTIQALFQVAAASSSAGSEPGERPHWRRRIQLDLFLLGLFFVVVYVHFHLKMWVPLINDRSFDAAFFATDEHVRFLIDGLRDLRASLSAVLPALDAAYHSVYFAFLLLAFWFHATGTRKWHVHSVVALTLVQVIGALLYFVAPAVGPFAFEAGDNARAADIQQQMFELYMAMQDGGVVWMEAHGAEYFTAPLAAMPSLHFACALVVAYYAVRARLVIAPLIVFAAAWIAIEAVVTRWHYVVDMPAGGLVAVVAIVLANRLCGFRLREGRPAGAVDPVAAPRPVRVAAQRSGV